jgi:phosphoesterase RecJ-like protein
MKEKFKELKKLINDSDSILLATHENPDADGVSSMLAFSLYLKSLGKNHSLYTPNNPSRFLSFLPNFKKIKTEIPEEKIDLVIGFDYADIKKLHLDDIKYQEYKMATLDHHKNTHKGDLDIINPDYSATAEIVYAFFKENNLKLTKGIASCIYAGIVQDTVGFSENNTTKRVFKISSELLDLDIEHVLIYKKVLGLKSIEITRLTGLALSRFTINKETKSAYSYLSQPEINDMNVTWEDLDHIPCMLNYTDGLKFVFFLRDREDDTIRVSFRSDSQKKYDVSKLAEHFGGGGHKFKAAAKIKGGFEETLNKILELAKKTDFSIK